MKLDKNLTTDNAQPVKMYDYYIAIDWSLESAAIARMKSNSIKPVMEQKVSANIKVIKEYLKGLKGTKTLTIEETTGAQWLYVELKDSVDKIIICNPSRNRLLEEGPKTDPIDAGKLCQLLRAGLLKEVYHTDNENNYRIRKLVSAYDDLITANVRVKNQLSAVYRSVGLRAKKDKYDKEDKMINFILGHQNEVMNKLNEEQKKFEKLFAEVVRKNEVIKYIKQISGLGNILAVKAYGIIIDANRFENKYRLWSYSGLVKYKRESGKRSFDKKNKKYSRKLKCVFKMATQAALIGKNDIREFYEYLLTQGFTEKDARNTITRYIATSVYAVMKKRTKYEPYHWRKKLRNKAA
jgi:hypothetical protein